MSVWLFTAALVGALVVGFVLGAGSCGWGRRGRRSDGKPWWYDVAFPQPDEATLGALKVLADRYALGEIDAEEYHQRAKALQESAAERATSASGSKLPR